MSTQIKISIFALVSILICITVFSLTVQSSFAETRQECRSAVAKDQSHTPVERVLALRDCSKVEDSFSSFSEIYTEERHNECERRPPHDTWLNHVIRMRDFKECNRLEMPENTSKQQITKFSKFLVDFCGEKYGVYKLVGANKLRNHAGISTPICLDLFSTPIWNSTDKDRQVQLHNFLIDKTQERLQVSKEIREKIVEESRLNRPIITTLKDLFDEQKQKIDSLESQLFSQNITPDYSEQDFFSRVIENCSEIYYDDTILLKEKIGLLNECFGIEETEPVVIDHTAIAEYSKGAVEYCENWYPLFSQLDRQQFYYNYTKDPLTQKCSMLYSNPLWSYDKDDRRQNLEALLNIQIQKKIYENSIREDSTNMAIMDSRWEPVLVDIYKYQKQKIEFLESLLFMNQN